MSTQAANFSISARSGFVFACQQVSSLHVARGSSNVGEAAIWSVRALATYTYSKTGEAGGLNADRHWSELTREGRGAPRPDGAPRCGLLPHRLWRGGGG